MERTSSQRPWAAHIAEDGRVQTVQQHLEGVAQLARQFGGAFGAGELAYQCGLVHDIGKYTAGFQRRIWENGPIVDHATAGAREIARQNGALAAYCVAGHHGGLPDGGGRGDGPDSGTLMGRLNKPLEPYGAYAAEIHPAAAQFRRPQCFGTGGFTASFFTHMLFSCLVDADYLDTETFFSGQRTVFGEPIAALSAKLDVYVEKWWDAKTDLNRRRCQILRACMDAGREAPGLFTLTVPTGGGKTVSSLAFALRHALAHGMTRVVYVIPYCSIIEQTADTFRDILGDENVLEHHSGANYDSDDDDPKRLATENWEVPVVVTTAVQFFESLFSNKPSACRKLHNLANSVIIFDEAQTLPLPYLQPCVRAIAELTANYGASCVLCTATQPTLQPLLHSISPSLTPRELCPDPAGQHEFFRRVRYRQLGELSDIALAARLNEHAQALCIVTTRAQAQAVYDLLEPEGSFHLSTLMTPEHRRAVLAAVRDRLKNGQPCRVVSTSLIEAGVDVDFPVVYRAWAGLDSMVQAAGRCNREGKNSAEESMVSLFDPEAKYQNKLPHALARPLEVSDSVLRQYSDPSDPAAITAYFSQLYQLTGDALDKNRVVPQFESGPANGQSYPFAKVAQAFHLVENDTRAVLIPRDEESRALARQLRGGQRSRKLMRQLGRYSVNIYKQHFDVLYELGALERLDESVAILTDASRYHNETGLELITGSGYGLWG